MTLKASFHLVLLSFDKHFLKLLAIIMYLWCIKRIKSLLYMYTAPVCGPCEVLRKKRDSKCCPEYECGA